MIILDTNVISEGFRLCPDARVRMWMDAQPSSDLFLCSPVLAELRYGVERMPIGARRAQLDRLVLDIEKDLFGNRILPLDRESAYEFGRVVARRASIGRPINPMDALIAAIAIHHRMVVATRDIRDFADLGLALINPFEATAER